MKTVDVIRAPLPQGGWLVRDTHFKSFIDAFHYACKLAGWVKPT